MVRRLNEGRGKSDLRIDMWYGDEFNPRDYGADAVFYPNRGCYAGNIYRLSDGKIVGDYTCSDSVVIERELGVKFNESRRPKTIKKSMKESLEPDAGPIEVYNINKGKIESEYEDAVEEAMTYIGSDETVPTWHWNIGEDEDNYYAIVLGFSEERDLVCKWAYIAKNSAMNDYAWDYLMPYDSDTGEVWDSEQSVDDGYGDVDYLLDDFKRYADQRNAELDEFEDDLHGDFDDDDFGEDDLEYESIRLKRESTNKRRPKKKQ